MGDLELPELPGEIESLSVDRLRRQGTLIRRLPSIPGVSVEKFFMGSGRADEAAAYAYAMGIAYEEDRRRAIIMRAKARAAARIAQAIAEYRM